jgi:hypothetical protein
MTKHRNTVNNFSYPSSAAAVVFGGYLSARAFGLTGNRPQQATFHTTTVSPSFEITKN